MDIYIYLLTIIGLTIFILFYGGHNYQNKIEYESIYFENFNLIKNYYNKLNKFNEKDILNDVNFVNINQYFETTNILIPNFVNCFLIKINPYNIFNIYNIINKDEINNHLLILFNYNNHDNLELLLNNTELDLYKKNILNDNCDGYFYSLNKIISIIDVYHIYNNSNNIVKITCFVVKKPFWHY